MASTRLLVFNGSLQNEGNLWAFELNNTIIIAGAGCDMPKINNRNTIINIDYLRENVRKIKAVFINNLLPKNSGLVNLIYDELDLKVPLYTSILTKIALQNYCNCNRNVSKNIIEIESLTKEVTVDDFTVSFFQLDSYVLGNTGFAVYNDNEVFYYLEDFSFNTLSNNSLLFKPLFFQRLRKFLSVRRKKVYLVTGCQNLNLNNNNSLFLESERFIKQKNVVLLVYDFDLLHIIEILEIAQRSCKKVNILDKKMFNFLHSISRKDPISKIIEFTSKESNENLNLLTVSVEEMEQKISLYASKSDQGFFVSCLFPLSGSEERLARVIDFLYNIDKQVLNLGRSENLNIGTNFYDLKFILKNLKPVRLLLLQNSYKHNKYLSNLQEYEPVIIPNQHYFDTELKKLFFLKSDKSFVSTDNLLYFQREKLLRSGLLAIVLKAAWQGNELKLLESQINPIAVSTTVDLAKLERKIKQWWATKISADISPLISASAAKQNIERRFVALVKNYLSFENDVEIEDPLFLIFIKETKTSTVKSGT